MWYKRRQIKAAEARREVRERADAREARATARQAIELIFMLSMLVALVVTCVFLFEGARTTMGFESIGRKMDRGVARFNEVFAHFGEKTSDGVTAVRDKMREDSRQANNHAVTVFDNGAAHVDQAKDAVRQRVADLHTGMTDATITASIKADLLKDPVLSATRVEVDATAGAVVLRGKAPTESARDRAGRMAAAVAGVRQVDNQLVVTGNG